MKFHFDLCINNFNLEEIYSIPEKLRGKVKKVEQNMDELGDFLILLNDSIDGHKLIHWSDNFNHEDSILGGDNGEVRDSNDFLV